MKNFGIFILSLFQLAFLSSCFGGGSGSGAYTDITPEPMVSGQVVPLVGLIVKESSNSSLIDKAYASCSNVPLQVFELTADGSRSLTPVVTASLNSAAQFSFPKKLVPKVDEQNVRYVAIVQACGAYYASPLLDSGNNQNIDARTTFMSFAINAALSKPLYEISRESLKTFKQQLSGSSINAVLTDVDGDVSLQGDMDTLFGAGAFESFKNAAPKIISKNISPFVNEATTTLFQVNAFHMNPAYDFGYEWYLDGALQQKSVSNWSYTTDEDSQGPKTILLRLGTNDGSGGVDQSKPFTERSYQITVSNTVAPEPLAIALDTGKNTSATNLVNIDMNTGSALANCNSFLTMALTVDDEEIPNDADFNITCSDAPVQTVFNIDVGVTNGTKVIRLWAKDSSGQISVVPSTLSFELDTVNPEVSLSYPGALYKNGDTVTLNFSSSDSGTGVATLAIQYASDGINFTTVTGPAPSDTTYDWAIPNDTTANAKLRIIATDTAGNVSIDTTSAFEIDSTAPTAPSITLTSGAFTTSTAVTMTMNSCSGTSHVYVNEGTQPSANDAGWVACSTVANAVTYTLDTVQELKTLKVWAKDLVGNLSSSTDINVTYDTTNPTTSFTNPGSLFRGGEGVTLNFSANDGLAGLDSLILEYASDGVSFVTIQALATTDTSYTWTTPNDNTTVAKLRITATDKAGNSSQSTVSAFEIDSIIPSAPAATLTSSEFTTSTAVTMTMGNCTGTTHIFVNEGSAPLEGDAGWQSCTTTADATIYTLDTVQELKTLKVWAKDLSGNISTSTDINVTYDTTNPTTTFTDPGTLFKGGEVVSLSFSANDAVAGLDTFILEYASDGTTFATIQTLTTTDTSFNWTIPGDNTTTAKLRVTATDKAGNSANSVVSAFEIDSSTPTAPSVTLTSPEFTTSTAVTMTASDCTGVSHILINEGPAPTEGDATWQACSTTADAITHTLDTVQELNILKVWAKDLAGNISTSTDINVTYDTTNPTTSFTNPGTLFRGGEVVSLSFSASDALAGLDTFILEYAADGTTYSTIQTLNLTDTSYDWTVPGDNTTTAKLRVTATDKAGNSASTVVTAFEIDSSAPSAPSATLTSGAFTNSTAVTMTMGNCTDTSHVFINEGTAPAEGDAGWQACSTTADAITFTLDTVQELKTLKVWAKDLSGNISTSTSINVTYDTTNPVPSFTSPGTLFRGGEIVSLSFGTTDALSGMNAFILEYASNGTTFSTIQTLNISDTSYNWTVPGDNTTTAKLRVTATDKAGNSASATVTAFEIDSTTPSAPSVTLTSPVYSTSTAVTMTAGNCTGTSHILVNEGPAPAEGDAGWQTCSTAANAITHTLDTVQELKPLQVWAKDLSGNISTSTGINVTYDTTNPTTVFTNPGTLFRGGEVVSLSFSATDAVAGLNSFILQYASDGVTFSTIQTLATTDTSYNWTVPAHNTTNAKLRVVATDRAGNSSTSTLTAFEIDSIAPGAAPATLTSGANSASTAVTMTMSNCTGISHVQINEGTQPAYNAGIWQPCTTTANAITYTMAASEGTHNLKVWAKDAADNVGSTSTNIAVVYDVSNPSASLTSFTGGEAYKANPVNITWSATDLSFGATPITLEYSTNGGTSWSALAGPISNSGSYSWNVTGIESTQVRVRLTATDTLSHSTVVTSSSNIILDRTAPVVGITSPADGSGFKTSITLTGTCENGLYIDYAGSGILAAFTSASPCSGGAYSQSISVTAGDGAKEISVSQTDVAGNIGSVTYTFNRDNIAPVISRTTGDSPALSKNNTVSWGGNCESGLNIVVSGDATDTITCNGTWSWTCPAETTDGSYSYTLTQTDSAGNSSGLPLNWTRDNTPPTFTINDSGPVTTNNDTISFNGTCETGFAIDVSGDATASFACTSGTWSWTSPTVTVDGTKTYNFAHTDTAGNVTSINGVDWIRDTTGPALTLDSSNDVYSNTDTATFSGTCDDLYSVTVSGAESSSATCTSGAWSWTTSVAASDATRSYTFAQFDGSNTTSHTADWTRDTVAPTFDTLALVSGGTTLSDNFTSLQFTGTDERTNITHFCLKSNDSVAPTDSDGCWVSVNSPEAGSQTPALSLSVNPFSYLVGWTAGAYSVYGWVKDYVGNISTLTATGAGTVGTDRLDLTIALGTPPEISGAFAANSTTPSWPLTTTDATILAGQDVHIKWTASDDVALPAGAISIYYTYDDSNYTLVADNLTNGSNGSCTVDEAGTTADDNATGCYVWTGGSPLSSYYRFRVVVTDSGGLQKATSTAPINSNIKILAGNLDEGVNANASNYLFGSLYYWPAYVDNGSFVVTNSGKIFFRDMKYGIMTVNNTTKKMEVYIPISTSITGDGGAVGSATVQRPYKLTLDYSGNLLILDYDRIRKVNLNVTPNTIDTIIGGGADTADTVANPLDVKFNVLTAENHYSMLRIFTAAPNGDIYFQTESASYASRPYYTTVRMRKYNAFTGETTSIRFSGTGVYADATLDVQDCGISMMRVKFDPSTSELTHLAATAYLRYGYGNCSYGTVSGQYTSRGVNFDPATGVSSPDHMSTNFYYQWHHGMDGKLYAVYNYFFKEYMPETNTYSASLAGVTNKGECDDGTLATSCQIDMKAIFVTSSGQKYFLDNGSVRTIDADGKVVTVWGERYQSGDGGSALSARLSRASFLEKTDAGKYIISGTYRIREFTPGGNINTIAGNGNFYEFDNHIGKQATAYRLRSTHFAVDPATGDLYTTSERRGSNYHEIIHLDRDGSGEFVAIAGAGSTDYKSGDTLDGNTLALRGHYHAPIGFENGEVLVGSYYHTTATGYYDNFVKSYNPTTRVQSHVAGVAGSSYGNGSSTALCANGTDLTTCNLPVGYYIQPYYDSANNRYITGTHARGWVVSLTPGGTKETIATLPRSVYGGVTYRKITTPITKEIVYYCSYTTTNTGRFYKYDITTSTETLIDLGLPDLYCNSWRMHVDEATQTITLSISKKNGVAAIVQYKDEVY